MTREEFEDAAGSLRTRLMPVAGRFARAAGTGVEAEDMVQEALAELWTLVSSGYPVRNAEALAVKVTKSVCMRHLRKRRPATVPIDGVEREGGMRASEGVEMQEILRIRKMLYERLTDSQRRYLTMKNEQGMSLDEIAAETGRPKPSIKVTLSQARKMMNEWLKGMQR